jgi:hypothetical protein
MDPNQPRVRDKIYQLNHLIHKIDTLFALPSQSLLEKFVRTFS